MKNYWQLASDKVLDLSLRERSLILITAVFLLIFGISHFVLDDLYQKEDNLKAQLRSSRQSIQQLKLDKATLENTLRKDPNEATLLELARVKGSLQNTDDELALFTADLIGAKEMTVVLGDILQRANKVKLISLESLPVQPLMPQLAEAVENKKTAVESAEPEGVAADALEDGADDIVLYQHGLRIKLSGSYFDIQKYLQEIETLPKNFYWRIFDYQTTTYPKADVLMEIYTVSMDKEFIRG